MKTKKFYKRDFAVQLKKCCILVKNHPNLEIERPKCLRISLAIPIRHLIRNSLSSIIIIHIKLSVSA